MRGFVFTIDSFMALLLVIFALSALLMLSNAPKSAAGSYSRLYLLADDSLEVLSALDGNGTGIPEGESALVAVGRLCSQGKTAEAGEIAKNVLEPILPEQFGFALECEGPGGSMTAYSRQKEESRMRASSARVVIGQYPESDAPAYCLDEKCPLCNGPPPGVWEREDFGPLILRLSVWV